MATISIGSGGGRDYATLQAAWNALPATLAENYTFELYNDSVFTGPFDTSASAKTMGAYTVTIKPAAVNGVFNKFVYVQSLGGFYYQPSHASNGWFLSSE